MADNTVTVTLLALILLSTISTFHCFASRSSDRLLLISFDGFRWDYLNRTDTPNFDRITKNGVRAVHGLKNAFITKTFPNHFTLVTGQWEESHGIVANYMFDPVLNENFSPHDEAANMDSAWFDVGGEPIWVTNQLQREDGKSGVIMWVGGGARIKNVLPTTFLRFDHYTKNKTKVDTMIQWFKDDKCNLGLLFFDQPDRFGHMFGPESDEVTRMIGGLDKVVGYLLDKLKEENMLETTNIIITSDHGFTSTPEDKGINLAGVVDPTTFKLESSTPVAGIWPHPGYHDAIFDKLNATAEKNGHFTVYNKNDIPEHFHYTHNIRIPPILAVADDHYSFTLGNKPEKGNHGYDNRLQDMHPFFVASGPAFKSGFTIDTFESVDVYPLMCYILGLKAAPNNGSMHMVKALLKVENYNVYKYLKNQGNHGYDNRLQDMHPFFVASGPAFKSGFTIDTFESVDVYPLMCYILGLEPAPNNGSMHMVKALLKVENYYVYEYFDTIDNNWKYGHDVTIMYSCIFVAGVVMMVAYIVSHEVRKKKKQQENVTVIMDNVTVVSKEEETIAANHPDKIWTVPILQSGGKEKKRFGWPGWIFKT